MDFAGSGLTLVIRADKMVLAVVLVSAAGAEIQLGSAVGTVEQTGENACLLYTSMYRALESEEERK